MNHPPPVIATNKWTRMWPPVVWVACFLAIPGVVAGAVVALWRVQDESVFDINEEDLVGIDDSKSFLRQDALSQSSCFPFCPRHAGEDDGSHVGHQAPASPHGVIVQRFLQICQKGFGYWPSNKGSSVHTPSDVPYDISCKDYHFTVYSCIADTI